MAVRYYSAPHSAADQVAQLLAELDVFDQETARLSREWEATAMPPRGSIGEGDFYQRTSSAYCHVSAHSWDTWRDARETRPGQTVGKKTEGPYALPVSAGRLDERSERNWVDRGEVWKAETASRSGGLEGWEREWNNAAKEHGEVRSDGLSNRSEGGALVDDEHNLVANGDSLGSQSERERVCGRGLDGVGGLKEDGRDGLEKGEALVRPRKAAFTFSRTLRFSEHQGTFA